MIGLAGVLVAAVMFGTLGYRWGRTDERDSVSHYVAVARPIFSALDLLPPNCHLTLDVVWIEEDGDEFIVSTVKGVDL